MSVLTISHVPASNPPVFTVQVGRVSSPTPIAVTSPSDVQVPGRPNSSLRTDLRWYLEKFLEYPYSPLTDEAARIVDTLRAWGRTSFEALFGVRSTAKIYEPLASQGLETLTLEIESDDPAVLAWPWEALEDAERGILGHQCAVIRRLRQAADPPPLLAYPEDSVNVLLITCRPYEDDVRFGAIARPLVELVHERQLPAHVTVLRPPTIEALTEHLAENRGRYHIVHFDGHGGFGHDGARRADLFRGPMGKLIFENEAGEAHAIDADRLTNLLREHRIPIVVLNACQSAMTDGADDPFASVAAALIKAGVRSVVAMAYSLYVTGAQEFLPAFYTTLFRTGSVREAVRGGRQRMLQHPSRGLHELQDWVVPVLYEHAEPYALTFATSADAPSEEVELPEGAEQGESPHGLVGRDETLLRLERALRGRPPAIVLHAMAGMGKTTLATGFLRWLGQTDGMDGAIWIRFDQGFRTAEYVLDRMLESLSGTPPGPEPFEAKLSFLKNGLRNVRAVIVWDNFEVVAGIPENPNSATFSPEERARLRQIVSALRGTRAKILITSRRDEPWLDLDRIPIPLPNLNAEDRQILATRILTDLGISVPKDDAAFGKLLDDSAGCPLTLRVVLPKLRSGTPNEIVQWFTTTILDDTESESEIHQKAVIESLKASIPTELHNLLLYLRFCNPVLVPEIFCELLSEVQSKDSQDITWKFISYLQWLGIAESKGRVLNILPFVPVFSEYELWPRLTQEESDLILGRFIRVVANKVSDINARQVYTSFKDIELWKAHLYLALSISLRLDKTLWHKIAVGFSDALYELSRFSESESICREGLDLSRDQPMMLEFRIKYLETLGQIMHSRGLLEHAREVFGCMYEACLLNGDEVKIAHAEFRLGLCCYYDNDLERSRSYIKSAVQVYRKVGNDRDAAYGLHQEAMILDQLGELQLAKDHYLAALETLESIRDDRAAARTLRQLGILMRRQGNYAESIDYHVRENAIFVRLGDQLGEAESNHSRALALQCVNQLEVARSYEMMALQAFDVIGHSTGLASSLDALGSIAFKLGRYDEAEGWYKRSLEIEEGLERWSGVLISCANLGLLMGARNLWSDAARYLSRAAKIAFEHKDPASEKICSANISLVLAAPESERPTMWQIWTDAGLPMPEMENE